MISLINESYQDVMSHVPYHSVDLLITQIPFNIEFKNNGMNKLKNRTGLVEDFGEQEFEFVDFLKYRLSKNSSAIIFTSWRNFGGLTEKMEQCGFEVKDMIRLYKTNPMPRNMDRRYISNCEYGLWFAKKHGKWTFNNITDKSYMLPEFYSPVVHKKDRLYPFQKPLDVVSDLIKIHSNEDDLVLDIFMNVGTTGVASMALNRNYFGFESDRTLFNIAKERIENSDFVANKTLNVTMKKAM